MGARGREARSPGGVSEVDDAKRPRQVNEVLFAWFEQGKMGNKIRQQNHSTTDVGTLPTGGFFKNTFLLMNTNEI